VKGTAVMVFALAACSESISPEALGDYENPDAGWYRMETYGPAPGHGDTYRIIYANPVARTTGTQSLGAILVKEVFDDMVSSDQHAPGSLRYVAIRRKIRGGIAVEDDGGWLFSQSDLPGGAETHDDTCWSRCHVQAPFAGVWFDYTK
jgi:hypothetical protein